MSTLEFLGGGAIIAVIGFLVGIFVDYRKSRNQARNREIYDSAHKEIEVKKNEIRNASLSDLVSRSREVTDRLNRRGH
jgi:hypothetical protein